MQDRGGGGSQSGRFIYMTQVMLLNLTSQSKDLHPLMHSVANGKIVPVLAPSVWAAPYHNGIMSIPIPKAPGNGPRAQNVE